jgi:NitT/TauT family transport system substrate-binding protein
VSTMQSRRRFLTTLSLAGAAGLVRAPRALAAEGPLETTTIRLPKGPGICPAPEYAAEELLYAEGFTEVRYVYFASQAEKPAAIGRGELDFGLNYAPQLITAIDVGEPVTVLAGVHVGCFELFGKEGIRTVADLKERAAACKPWGRSRRCW